MTTAYKKGALLVGPSRDRAVVRPVTQRRKISMRMIGGAYTMMLQVSATIGMDRSWCDEDVEWAIEFLFSLIFISSVRSRPDFFRAREHERPGAALRPPRHHHDTARGFLCSSSSGGFISGLTAGGAKG